MWSLESGVSSIKCSVKKEVWSVNYGVGSVECMECKVWSVKCGE